MLNDNLSRIDNNSTGNTAYHGNARYVDFTGTTYDTMNDENGTSKDLKFYRELEDLRERHKNRIRFESCRSPTICRDEALSEIVRLKPRTTDDICELLNRYQMR